MKLKNTKIYLLLVILLIIGGFIFAYKQNWIRQGEPNEPKKSPGYSTNNVKPKPADIPEDEYIFLSELHEPKLKEEPLEQEEEDYSDRTDGYNPHFIGLDYYMGTSDSEDQEQGDTDSIASALVYFRDRIVLESDFPHYTYPILSYRLPLSRYEDGYGGRAFDGIVRLLWESRKDILFDKLLSLYSPLLKEYISGEIYTSRGYDRIVKQLIVAYDDLSSQPEKFDAIYRIMLADTDEYEGYDIYRYYNSLMKEYISEESFTSFDDPEEDFTRIVWVYSFWARRQKEGIQENVYRGLLKLQEMYEEE